MARRRDIQRRFLKKHGWRVFYEPFYYGWLWRNNDNWDYTRQNAFNKELWRHSKNVRKSILSQLKGAV